MSRESSKQQTPQESSKSDRSSEERVQTSASRTAPLLLQRAHADPSSLTPTDVKHLQRTIGNRAVIGLLSRSTQLQAKLKLGPAGDQYEQEADRVAQQVVRQIDRPQPVQRTEEEEELAQAKPFPYDGSRLQRTDEPHQNLGFVRPGEAGLHKAKPLASGISQLQRTPSPRPTKGFVLQRQEEEEEELQMKALHGPEGGAVEQSVEKQIQTARGGGKALDDNVRGSMEKGFGADFSNVRVHTGDQADHLNRSLNARAFTVGSDVFFKRGEYNPGSSGGRQLLAHELTHTVQQGATSVQTAQRKLQTRHPATRRRTTLQRGYFNTRVYDSQVKGKTKGQVKGATGRSGSVGSQEMALNVLNLSVEERAARLKYLLKDKPVSDNTDGFERVAMALAGETTHGLLQTYANQSQSPLYGDIESIFSHPYRREYLTDMVISGQPSVKSQFAMRLGLLHGFRLQARTMFKDSGLAHKEDVIKLASQVSASDLKDVLNRFGDKIRQFYGNRFMERLEAHRNVKEQEGQDNSDAGQQLKLRYLYDQELAAIVEQRKHTISQYLRLKGKTSKKKMFDELQAWGKDKDATVIKEIVGNEQSRFRRTLKMVIGDPNITYITKLMTAPDSSLQDVKDANAFQQVEAILEKKQSRGKTSFKRWRQNSETRQKVDSLLFKEGGGLDDPQKALLTWHLDKKGISAQNAQQIISLWESGQGKKYYDDALAAFREKLSNTSMKDSQKQKLLNQFRYGRAANGIYQKLKTRTDSWRSGMRYREGRSTLDIIQQLQPGTAEYELVRKDTEMLKKIKKSTHKGMWAKIAAVLNITDSQLKTDNGLTSYIRENVLEDQAKQTWQGAQPGSVAAGTLQAKTWARFIDAELSSNLVDEDVVFKHVFKAQEAAWTFAIAAVTPNGYKPGGDPKQVYQYYMQAIRSHMQKSLFDMVGVLPEFARAMTAVVTLGTSLIATGVEDRGWSQGTRLLEALNGGYDKRLTVADLLNVARKRGGKGRTNVQAIEDTIDALSGKELLDAWSNFPDLLQEGQRVAGVSGDEGNRLRRHMKHLRRSIGQKMIDIAKLNGQLQRLQTGDQQDPTKQKQISDLQDKVMELQSSQTIQQKNLDDARLELQTAPAQKQEEERVKFAAAFALKVRPEFWDQELGGFGEFEGGHVSFRDLLKRGDRVRVERKLLDRLAAEAPKAPEFQQLAGQVMGTPDGVAAAKYLAARTKAIGGLETAQLLSSGKQWSYYSTRSMIYKEAQRGYVGEFRSGSSDIAKSETSGQSRAEAIKAKTGSIETAESTLRSEEEAFVALRDKYNSRFKAVIMALVAVLMTALSVFTGGASFAPGFAVLFALFTSLVSSGIGALIDYTNEGEAYNHADHIRDTIFEALVSCSGALIGNVGFTIKSLGAKAIFDGGEAAYIFGRPALDIATKLGVELTSTVVNAPVNLLNRFLQSSSLNETWNKIETEAKDRIKSLPMEIVVDYFKGVVMASGDIGMAKLAEAMSEKFGWKDSDGNPLQFLVQATEDPTPTDANDVGVNANPLWSSTGNIFWDPKGNWSGANQYAWNGTGLFNTGGEDSGFMGLGKFSINKDVFTDPSKWNNDDHQGMFNAMRVFVQAPRDALTEYLFDSVTGRVGGVISSGTTLTEDREIDPQKAQSRGPGEDQLILDLAKKLNLDTGHDLRTLQGLLDAITDPIVKNVVAKRLDDPNNVNLKAQVETELNTRRAQLMMAIRRPRPKKIPQRPRRHSAPPLKTV